MEENKTLNDFKMDKTVGERVKALVTHVKLLCAMPCTQQAQNRVLFLGQSLPTGDTQEAFKRTTDETFIQQYSHRLPPHVP